MKAGSAMFWCVSSSPSPSSLHRTDSPLFSPTSGSAQLTTALRRTPARSESLAVFASSTVSSGTPPAFSLTFLPSLTLPPLSAAKTTSAPRSASSWSVPKKSLVPFLSTFSSGPGGRRRRAGVACASLPRLRFFPSYINLDPLITASTPLTLSSRSTFRKPPSWRSSRRSLPEECESALQTLSAQLSSLSVVVVPL